MQIMLSAVNGYFDGTHVVLTESITPKKGQKALVIFLDEEDRNYTAADKKELMEVSDRLINKNYEAYKELAK